MLETIGGMIATALWSGLFSSVLGKGWFLERAPFWGCLAILGVVWLVLRRLGRFGSVVKMDRLDGSGSEEEAA